MVLFWADVFSADYTVKVAFGKLGFFSALGMTQN